MANYTLTAFSKDAQAVQVGAQQSTKYSNYRANIAGRQAEQSYLREIEREYAERQREADRIALEEARERENQNFFVRALSTIGDIVGDIITGALKGLEGIVDFGAGLVGAVGGIFSSDFAKNVQNFIATDYATTYVGNPLEELTKYSYTNDGDVGQWFEGAASGIGQMLPAVAITVATAGAGAGAMGAQAAAKAGQIAGTIAFGVSAAGMSQEEAYQNGADYYQGFGYGLLSGALETAIEMISGGASKYFMGAGLIDKVVDKVVKESATNLALKKGLEFAVDVLGEGMEEVISEALNPYLKKITYDPDAEGATFEDLLTAGVIGSLTSLGMGGGDAVVRKINKSYGASAEIQEGLSDINVLERRKQNLWNNSKLDTETSQKIDDIINKTKQKMSNALQKVKPSKREAIIDNYREYGLAEIINEDGTLKESITTKEITPESVANTNPELLKGNENILEETEEREQETIPGVVENVVESAMEQIPIYNRDSYSLDLQGQEETLTFKPTTKELTESQKSAKKLFASLNRGVRQANIVFTDELGTDSEGNVREGAYQNGILYINTEANATKTVTLHELTHWAEETKEYNKFANYILKELQTNLSLPEEFNNLKKTFEDTREAYEATLTEKYQDELKSQDLAARQEALKKAQNEILSEIVAKYSSEYLFTDEASIKRLARSNKNFFQKLLQWIKDRIAILKGKTKEERETIKFLRKAEALYRNALDSAWGANYEAFKKDSKYSVQTGLERAQHYADEYKRKFKETGESPYREMIPKWKGKLTKEKIVKYLKDGVGNNNTGANFVQALLEYDSIEDIHENIYYHGTGGYIPYGHTFKPSVALPKNSFRGGGYDENYFAASASKSRNRASMFTGLARSGTLYTILLRRYAKVIEMPQISDSVELEDHIVELWEQGVDAVKIGNWDDKYSEQELCILNPKAVAVGDTEYFQVFGKPRFNNFTLEEIQKKYDKAIEAAKNKDWQNARFSIRYTKKDSDGKQLTEKQQEYFKNSKVVDEDGNLLKVYHGSTSGEFSVFDAAFSNVESDMGAGFYFSDSLEDVMSNYEDGGQDLEGKISRLAERIESEEEIDYEEAEKKARAQLYKQPKRFDVYLNFENPAYVGGELDSPTYLLAEFTDNYNIEDFESEEEYYEQLDQDFGEFIDEVIYNIDSAGIYDYDGLQDILYEAYANGGITINDLKDTLNERVFAMDEKGNFATSEVLRIIIETLGYDGIIDNSVVDKWGYNSGRVQYMEGLTEDTRHYIAFKPNQIKLATNENPTTSQDIRYSISKTQYTKTKANLSREKVYNKNEAEKVINSIVENVMVFDESKYGTINNKTREEVVTKLFEAFNTKNEGYRAGVALDIANYLIDNTIVESIYNDGDNAGDIFIIDTLKQYLHGIDLSSIKGEIKYRYDTDNSPYLIWGKRKGRNASSPDQIAQELEDFGIKINAINEADIFFEIDDMYRAAVANLKNKTKETANSLLSTEERKALQQQIAREIMLSYDTNGKQSKFSATIDKFRKQILSLRDKLKTSQQYAKAIKNLVTSQTKAKEIVKRKYADGTKLENEAIKNLVGIVSKFTTYKGNLSKDVRSVVSSLQNVYTQDNILMGGENFLGENDFGGEIDSDIVDAINLIASGEGELSISEIVALDKITKGILHLYTTYDKVFKNGTYVDTAIYAERYIKQANEVADLSENSKMLKILSGKAMSSIIDPHSVMRVLDGYKQEYNPQTKQWEDVGFHTESLKEIGDGEVVANVLELELTKHFKEFFKNNKKFEKSLSNKTFSISVSRVLDNSLEVTKIDLTLDDAIKIVLYADREQANLFESGFTIEDKGRVRRYMISEEEVRNLASQFNKQENEFKTLVNKFFNEYAKKYKVETDEKLFGYAKIEDGNTYIPIFREGSSLAKDISTGVNAKDIISLNNLSMNKDTIEGANAALRMIPIMSMIRSHAHAVGAYYGMAIPLKNFNRIYNKKIGEGVFKKSIRQIDNMNHKNSEAYLRKFFNDIQGFRVDTTLLSRAIRKMRKSYASYQLGANLKTILGQPSSYWLAHNYIDMDSLFKGLFMKNSKKEIMYKYCPFTEYRMEDNSIIKAQGVMDSVSDFADKFTAGIQFMDNMTVAKLWNACQIQIKKNNGYAIGSEENLKLAGQLLEKVVRETQSNSIVSEKTGLSRHQNELISSLTMFSSDAQKQLSRLVDGVGMLTYAKARIKKGLLQKNSPEYKHYQKQLPKAISGYLIGTTQYILVGMLIKWLLGRDDEDEDFLSQFASDFATQIVGMFPFVKDVYGYVVNGYEINNYAFDMVNNLISAAASLFNMGTKLVSGADVSQTEILKPLRDTIYAIGQMTGIPVRNIYNYTYGIVEKFDASTAYKMNALFYETKKSDLQEAIQKGDSKLAATVTENLFGSKKLEINEKLAKEIVSLFSEGEEFIPTAVKDTITFEGETFVLNKGQKEKFSKVYNQAADVCSKLVEDVLYKDLKAETRADILSGIYKYYYNRAVEDLLGVELYDEVDNMFFDIFGIDRLMLYIKTAKSFENIVNENGVIVGNKKKQIQDYVNSLKLSAAEKYMLMGYLGYENEKGINIVRGFIQRQKLTRQQKEILLEASGY